MYVDIFYEIWPKVDPILMLTGCCIARMKPIRRTQKKFEFSKMRTCDIHTCINKYYLLNYPNNRKLEKSYKTSFLSEILVKLPGFNFNILKLFRYCNPRKFLD